MPTLQRTSLQSADNLDKGYPFSLCSTRWWFYHSQPVCILHGISYFLVSQALFSDCGINRELESFYFIIFATKALSPDTEKDTMVWTMFLMPKPWIFCPSQNGTLQYFMTTMYPKFTWSKNVLQRQRSYKRRWSSHVQAPIPLPDSDPNTKYWEQNIEVWNAADRWLSAMHRIASHNK